MESIKLYNVKKIALLILLATLFVFCNGQRTDSYSNHILPDSNKTIYKLSLIDTTGGVSNRDLHFGKYSENGSEIWTRLYGGGAHEYAGKFLEINNQYYGLGYTFSKGAGTNDILVTRVDSSGDLRSLICGNSETDEAKDLVELANGSLFLLGTTEIAFGNLDALCIKLDSNLLPLSSVHLDIEGDQELITVQETSVGSKKVIAGKHRIGSTYGDDMIVVLLDSLNQIEWAKVLRDTGDQEVNQVVLDSQDNIYLLGYTKEPNIAGLIVKMDLSGNQIWSYKYSTTLSNKFLRGKSSGQEIIVGGVLTSITGSYDDFFLLSIDSLGRVNWSKHYDYSDDEYVTGVQKQDSSILVHGPKKTSQGWMYQILEVDLNGRGCRSKNVTAARDTITFSDTTYSTVSKNFSLIHEFDSLFTEYVDTSYQIEKCYITKTGPDSTDTTGAINEGLQTNHVQMKLTGDLLSVSNTNSDSFELECFDLQGRRLWSREFVGSQVQVVLPQYIQTGVFVFRVTTRKGSFVQRMLKLT